MLQWLCRIGPLQLVIHVVQNCHAGEHANEDMTTIVPLLFNPFVADNVTH